MMVTVAGDRWLGHLDARAMCPIDAPALLDVLEAHAADQWIVVDAWGVALLDVVDEAMLPGRGPAERSFALTPERTTTDAFNALLLETRGRHAFEKIDVVDALIHERTLPIDDLARIARAELQPGLRRVTAKLDPNRPVLVFADHGFRLSKDGRRYVHGGPSTLERLVPLLRFS